MPAKKKAATIKEVAETSATETAPTDNAPVAPETPKETTLTVVDRVPEGTITVEASVNALALRLNDPKNLTTRKQIDAAISGATEFVREFGLGYAKFKRQTATIAPMIRQMWLAEKALNSKVEQIEFIKKFFPSMSAETSRKAQDWKDSDGFSPWNTMQYLLRQGQQILDNRVLVEAKRKELQASLDAASAPALANDEKAIAAKEKAQEELSALNAMGPEDKISKGRDSAPAGTKTIDEMCVDALTKHNAIARTNLVNAFATYQAKLVLADVMKEPEQTIAQTEALKGYHAECAKAIETVQRMTLHDYFLAKSIKVDAKSQYQRVMGKAFPLVAAVPVVSQTAGTTATVPTVAPTAATPVAVPVDKSALLALAHGRGEHADLTEYLDDCPTCMKELAEEADDAVDADERQTA